MALAWATPAPAAEPMQTVASHALLLDADTGTVLLEKGADDPVAPASLAKLMTAEVAFDLIRQGKLSLETEFPISENAWRKGGGPSRGTAMFAKLGSQVKVSDLLRGIIVQSGNDASIALAEGVSGSEEAFARLMNERGRAIGLTGSTFVNATGYDDPAQKVTMRDLVRLSLHLIRTYPDLYAIFAEREFTWNKIRQRNRNPLLAMEIGADGLKTGESPSSGFGLVGSAVQNGQRLVLAMVGLKSATDRSAEARKLIEWGFRSFEARQIFAAGETIGEAQVYGGTSRTVPLVAREAVRILVPRGEGEPLAARIVYRGPVAAPVVAGAELGRLQIMRGETQTYAVPLVAGAAVERGGLRQRALDALLELGQGLVRRAFARN